MTTRRLKILATAIAWLIALHGSATYAELIAHYDFTSQPGATAADESPGGTNPIPVSGSPTWLANDAGRSGVLSFANAGKLRLDTPVEKPANGAAFTVALWTKSDAPMQDDYSSLFSNGQGGTNHFQLDSDGAGNWRLFGGAYNTPFGPIVDTWTHIAVTWDGATTSWYYDGALVDTGATNPGGNFDNFRIGANRADNADGPVNAEMDDVRIYDHALNAGEIADLANPIPEPSTLILLCIGLLFGTVAGRRRCRRA